MRVTFIVKVDVEDDGERLIGMRVKASVIFMVLVQQGDEKDLKGLKGLKVNWDEINFSWTPHFPLSKFGVFGCLIVLGKCSLGF